MLDRILLIRFSLDRRGSRPRRPEYGNIFTKYNFKTNDHKTIHITLTEDNFGNANVASLSMASTRRKIIWLP